MRSLQRIRTAADRRSPQVPGGSVHLGFVLAWCACALICAGTSSAQSTDSTLWGVEPGGRVFTIARSGNTLYIGGNFWTLGPNTGGGVPIDIATAHRLPAFPIVAGHVNAVLSDGAGGWYVGGSFTTVNGRAHQNLAHLTPAGVDEAWAGSADGEVFTLIRAGPLIYVGGAFGSLSGSARPNLGAIDPATGTATAWDPEVNGRVFAIVVGGGHVYAGGHFTFIGGLQHYFFADIDSVTAAAAAWDPGLDNEVNALALVDTTLFIGGHFQFVGDSLRRYLGAFSVNTGALLPWNADVTRPEFVYDGGARVVSLIPRDTALYVAGSFKTIGGQDRQGLAAVSLNTAQATAWNPRSYSQIVFGAFYTAMAFLGDTLFVAGQADSLGSQPSSNLAAVSASSGARLSWDPRPNDTVRAMALAGGTLYAGGWFNSVGDWVRRNCLASFNATTGALTPWDPEPDDYVRSLVVSGNTVYAGGVFASVGGTPRSGLAALDGTSGAVLPWNPGGGNVSALAPWKNTLLVGGRFSGIGGQPRKNIAAIDTATGLATVWNPNSNDDVYSIMPSDSVIYLGGFFSAIGGLTRGGLAAVDTTTGQPTPWAPIVNGAVNSLVSLGDIVYAGGFFNSINGIERDGLAAIDASGNLTPWVANTDQQVRALATDDTTIYVGGFFNTIGGVSQSSIAALDPWTGSVRSWNPAPDGYVWGLTRAEGKLYVGGDFGRISGWPHSAIAAIALGSPPVYHPRSLYMVQSAPNPAIGEAVLHYALPAAASVTLDVFDLQGRRVATVLSHAIQTAGSHEVTVKTSGWRSGMYLCHIEANGRTATQKMVVMK